MSTPGSVIPLLLGSTATTYNVERSLRFNSSDSAYLSRTPASAGNRKTWTWAGWVKRSEISANHVLLGAFPGSGNYSLIQFLADNRLRVLNVVAGNIVSNRVTTRVFRDPSAWYHLVVSSNSSTSLKIYINGIEETAFDIATGPDSSDWSFNNNSEQTIGQNSVAGGSYFNGYLADLHLIDGQALTPSSFTEVSATTGRLEPKQYAGSFGTNGFWLKFSDNSAATATTLGKDYSGNSNNWTPNNLSISDTYKNAVVFDGNGDSLTVPSGASITGTGDFTIEMWMLPRSFGSGYQVFYANDTGGGVSFGIYSNGTIFFGKSLQSIDGTSSNSVTFGAWNHISLTRTSGTFRIFINGSQGFSGTPSINYASGVVRLGADGGGGALFFNGLLASLRTIQGTSLYSSNFTPPSAPLAAIAGTTLLACQSSTIIDQSANNFTLTAVGDTHVVRSYVGAAVDGSDSTVDTPTSYGTDTGAGEVRGNYATWNPLNNPAGSTFANGNLDCTTASGNKGRAVGTIAVSSGKWYWEVVKTGGSAAPVFGFTPASESDTTYPKFSYYGGLKSSDYFATYSSYGADFGTNDVIGVALDLDGGTCTFYKNGTSQGQAFSGLSGTFVLAIADDSNSNTINVTLNAGQRPFAYTAPSGFKALCDTNLPAPVVAKPSTVMDVKLYTGNGSTNSITGLGFSPDLVWLKSRSQNSSHCLLDTVRGRAGTLNSNDTAAEYTASPSDRDLVSFDSAGFTLGQNYNNVTNTASSTYAAWTWDAGSSTVTNTQGSITSQVRANASAGFSIVTYTGTGSSGSFGHGLNIAPSMFIIKSRGVEDWFVYHASLGGSPPNYMKLNTTGAAGNSSAIIPSAPSSTVINIGSGSGVGANGVNHVCYAFSPVAGYSSFGSYTGNGSAAKDGPFIYTGFRPRWIMIKNITFASDYTSWLIQDTARSPYNVMPDTNILWANKSVGEGFRGNGTLASAYNKIDAVSNGFKIREESTHELNDASATYIYAAFAESPFQYARAR